MFLSFRALSFLCVFATCSPACDPTEPGELDGGDDVDVDVDEGASNVAAAVEMDAALPQVTASASCGDAPVVSGSTRITGAGYVKLVAPPGFALGVWREKGAPTVCSGCDTFQGFSGGCTTEEVQPAGAWNNGVIRPMGPPLLGAGTNPREAVLHSLGEDEFAIGRWDEHVVYALPLPNTSAACDEGTLQVPEGRVVARANGCRATVTLQAGEALRPFGTPWLKRIDRSAVEATPVTVVLDGDVVAWQRLTLPPGWSCSAPMPLQASAEVVLRPDIGCRGEDCFDQRFSESHSYGLQYLLLTIPARSRVRLTGYAPPADGGGHAGLCALPSCGAPCDAVAEQPWVADGPPAELELTNTTMIERSQLVAVTQLFIGYDGQRVTVRAGPAEPLP
jgi:hypothetical protein